MIAEVIIPKTGLNSDDCHLLAWLADEGSKITTGQPIFTMETDKVEMDVEADEDGYLRHLAPAAADYPVGTVVGYIASTEEEYRSLAR